MVTDAATSDTSSGTMARSNQTGGLSRRDHRCSSHQTTAPKRGSTSPRAPVSMANRPPASALPRGARPRSAAADRRDEQDASILAAEGGHGRLLDRQLDAPVDHALRRDADHRPSVDTGDPVAAVRIDAGAIRTTGKVMEVQEDALVGGLAGGQVIVVGPDGLAMRVGEVHRRAVGREGEAVGDPDARSNGRHLALRADPVEQPREPTSGCRVEHAAHPEPTGRIAPSVIEPVARALGLQPDPRLAGRARPVEPGEPILERHEETADPFGQGDRAGASRHDPSFVEVRRWVVPVDRSALDVDPIETLFQLAPDGTLTQQRSRRNHALDPLLGQW